jgi:hypothetical protein
MMVARRSACVGLVLDDGAGDLDGGRMILLPDPGGAIFVCRSEGVELVMPLIDFGVTAEL